MDFDDDHLNKLNKMSALNTLTPLTRNFSVFSYPYLLLFILYFTSAYLFSLISPHNPVFSLWPPAGVALAGCLLWQSRFLPAILVGCLIFYLATPILNGNDVELSSIPLVIGLSLGSTLQAWVNYRLLTYFSLNILDAPGFRKVTLFICLALLSCLISSFIGCALNETPFMDFSGETFWPNMIIWWLGDFLGVILFTPMILVFFQSRHRFVQTLNHFQGLVYPLILVVVVLLIIQQYSNKSIRINSIEKVQVHSKLVEKDLNHQVGNYLSSLSSLAVSLSGNSDITQSEFEQIALPLIQQTPGTKAFSWNPIVDQHHIPILEENVNGQTSTPFKVRGEPLRQEDPLIVVKWIEPFAANEKAFGFNVFSNAERRKAMIKAQNLNAPVATETIQLVQLDTKEAGFLIFTPINQGPSLNDSILTRSFKLSGFAVGVFVLNDIVTTSLDNTSAHYMSVTIRDTNKNNEVIYHYSPTAQIDSSLDSQLPLDGAINFSFLQPVATRHWEITLSISPEILTSLQVEDSITSVIYESVLGALSVLLIMTLFSNHRVLLTRVKQRTQELETSRDQLKKYAFNDALTNLPNRRMFIRQATHALSLAKRTNKVAAILFLDLNRFKHVNDSFGHDFGDQLLIKVANNFKDNLRSSDILARFGGDEFTILIENLTSSDQAIAISKKLIHGLRQPLSINNESLVISTSIGIATYPKDGHNVNDLIRAADTAMYKAKESSDRFFCYSSTLRKQAREKLFIESELPQALEKKQLELYYQPVVELASGNHIGCECLLRWNHPIHGIISPDSFIPIAELSGEIIPIGAWVIDQACEKIKQWQRQGIHHKKVSINVSVVQLMSGKLTDDVNKSLLNYGINPGSLELEITESVLMQNIQYAIERIVELKKIGVRIAIDDYGTGYASLSYLKQLPVDSLKIDRVFIDQLNVDNMTIVNSTLHMANELGIDVIAEGIQTTEQMRILVEHDCRWGQGFLFSQPLPIAKYIEFCRKNPTILIN